MRAGVEFLWTRLAAYLREDVRPAGGKLAAGAAATWGAGACRLRLAGLVRHLGCVVGP